jgi:hypothetical protein
MMSDLSETLIVAAIVMLGLFCLALTALLVCFLVEMIVAVA